MAAALRLDEIRPTPTADETGDKPPGGSVIDSFKLTLGSGGWILKTPFVLIVILLGMLFDGILRMVITLASQYYRMVQLPESIYGLIGSVMAITGIFIPPSGALDCRKPFASGLLVDHCRHGAGRSFRNGLILALCGLDPGPRGRFQPFTWWGFTSAISSINRHPHRGGPPCSASRDWPAIFPTVLSGSFMQRFWR